MYTTPDGHTIKVDKTGDIGICSECTDLREEFADELIDNAELDSQLDSICAETDPKKKARLAAEFRQQLLEERWKRNPFREDQITRSAAGDLEYIDIKLDNGEKVTLKKQPDGNWKVEHWSGGEPTMMDAEVLGRAGVGERKSDRYLSMVDRSNAAERIKSHRLRENNLSSGNYGYVEGEINNIYVNDEIVRSGAPDTDIPEIFDAMHVNSKQEIDGDGAWLRTTDSEYKLLNRLTNQLGAVKGEIYPEIVGRVTLVSERKFCSSCSNVIEQFTKMFPNIELKLIDNVR